MEYKITNFDVATEKLCLEQTAEIPLEADFSAADYLGEIKKVLKCRITPFIISKQLSGNALTIEGAATLSVIYCDGKGILYTAETELPFKKTFESGKLLEGGDVEVELSATLHSVKAITERRLSVRGSVKINASVYTVEKKEIITDIDSECFELLRGDAPATTPLGSAEKSVIIEEDISLPDNLPPIVNVIRSSADVTISEHKIVSNKVIVKGSLKNVIVYCSPENEIKKYIADIPFSQIIDMVGISEDCSINATAEICNINLTTRTAENGTCKSLLLTGKLLITTKACCNAGVPVVLDTYCTRHQADIKREDVVFTDIAKQIDETFLCKKKIGLASGSADKIIDLWESVNYCNARFEKDKGIISGGIAITILFADQNGEYSSLDRVIDFEYPIKIDFESDTCSLKPQIHIKSCDYSAISTDEIELRLELNIKAALYRKRSLSLITEIKVDDTAPALSDGASLIAYYADKGENIWEISKSFLASKEQLIELNNLKNEKIDSPKMLLIPRM